MRKSSQLGQTDLAVPVGNLIRLATEAESERLIGSTRRECLDHVVVFGERHLRHVLLPYMNYYDETRTQIFGQGCSPIAHGSEGRAYSSPSNPGRAASPKYSDLICDWRKGRHRLIGKAVDGSSNNPIMKRVSTPGRPFPLCSGDLWSIQAQSIRPASCTNSCFGLMIWSSLARNRSPSPVVSDFFGRIVALHPLRQRNHDFGSKGIWRVL